MCNHDVYLMMSCGLMPLSKIRSRSAFTLSQGGLVLVLFKISCLRGFADKCTQVLHIFWKLLDVIFIHYPSNITAYLVPTTFFSLGSNHPIIREQQHLPYNASYNATYNANIWMLASYYCKQTLDKSSTSPITLMVNHTYIVVGCITFHHRRFDANKTRSSKV